MARVTVEDCVLVVPNRFELCLIASNRAKNIVSGSHTDFAQSGEKPAVIALREIGDNMLDIDAIRDNITSSIRNRTASVYSSEAESATLKSSTTVEMIESEIQDQQIQEGSVKEASFVSENMEIED